MDLVPGRQQKLEKAEGPKAGRTISGLPLGGNILVSDLSWIQHCSLVMGFHIKALHPVMELGVERQREIAD